MSQAQCEAEKRHFEHLWQLLYKTHPVKILRDQLETACYSTYGLIADMKHVYEEKLRDFGDRADP